MSVDYVFSVRASSANAFVAKVGPSRFLEVPENAMPAPDQALASTTWCKHVLDAAAWQNAQGQPRGDILFIVHGYNNSEQDVMQRHRIMKSGLAALGFKGVVVSFDWPSDDQALAYLADRHRAKETALKLVSDGISALSKRQTPDCATNIHLLCHSTGAYVVREAFDDADDTALKQSSWTVSQILFAAGDVSSDSLSAGNPTAASVYNHCIKLTNYSNRHDAVLDISNAKRLGIAPRVGRVGLPNDAPAKAVNVDCTDYWALLTDTAHPEVASADEPGGIVGAQSHSWYFGNAVFTRDVFSTVIGIEDGVVPTRDVNPDGGSRLIRA
ncbi:MAG TPA: alpha/beta hydrolase [Rudaea sp.]|nr:alpha/beta hydrolase [Rudaea sp.]